MTKDITDIIRQSLGCPIRIHPYLEGQKKAVKLNGEILVSPAMFDLMKHATPDELQTLCAEIGLLDLDEKQATLIITDKKRGEFPTFPPTDLGGDRGLGYFKRS